MQYCSIYCITAVGLQAWGKRLLLLLLAAAAAADRIDALLVAFAQSGTATWPDEFTKLLASAGGRTAGVATPAVVVAAEPGHQGHTVGAVRGGQS